MSINLILPEYHIYDTTPNVYFCLIFLFKRRNINLYANFICIPLPQRHREITSNLKFRISHDMHTKSGTEIFFLYKEINIRKKKKSVKFFSRDPNIIPFFVRVLYIFINIKMASFLKSFLLMCDL